MTDEFYDDPKDRSIAKATIVSKYFSQWANVMKNTVAPGSPIAYIDLFSGPGRYNDKDGTKSTPLLVLDQALKDDRIPQQLVLVFNDKNLDFVNELKDNVENYPGIERFKHDRRYWNIEVGQEILGKFQGKKLPPSLLFVDPWGYKGLSLELLNSVLKDWGCDVIFFFNYRRVNMDIPKPKAFENLKALFGHGRAMQLQQRVDTLSAMERELVIVEELAQALKGSHGYQGDRFVLPFRFKNEGGVRTTHHLVFVSKHFRGYEIMKDIMANESSNYDQGVPSFEYNRATAGQQLLFSLSQPLNKLGEMLLTEYAGQSIKMIDIYKQHSVDRPFTKKNYKSALWQLEAEGKIAATKHNRNSFADSVVATFPPTP